MKVHINLTVNGESHELLVPVGRWCMRVKKPDWKPPREEPA